MNRKMRVLLLVVLSTALSVSAATGEDYFAAPARGFVSSRSAGNDWEKSLLTGNGTMGVMVPGDPFDETLYLSHAALFSGGVGAGELHVSPAGDDANPGTAGKPLRTLAAAQQAARHAAPTRVLLHGGTYYLPETLVFTAGDSGVTYAAAPGEQPVLSGGVRLDRLAWKPYRNGILQAQVPTGFATDQLFVNGERQPMARYPNFNPAQCIFNGYAPDAIAPERVARWADPRGGFIHAMHTHMWGSMHYRITGKDAVGKLAYEGGWQHNQPMEMMGMHKTYRFVENIFEELDAPGEWFLDAGKGVLYFMPPAGVDPAQALVEGVRLRCLVEFRGTPQQPVKNVRLQGLTFRHAARTFMDTREPVLRSDWMIYRGGAVLFNGAEDCALEDCLLDQVGGNAVFVNNYNRRVTVRGCQIARAGASGVAFIGDTNAVRNALLNCKQRELYERLDRTPGPKTDNYPADCLVDDCLIWQSGRVEKQSAPVEIDMAQGITVRHCSLYDVPRAGVNIGDGCWGGHVVEFCDIFDTVRESGDHGAFNSWGRDRYWALNGAPAAELPQLARLDAVRPNVLRNNRWRCDHGWDVDLDDGSSNYEIYNNLFLNRGLKLREGYHRRVWNNIAVNNSLHPHLWFERSGDIVTNNIWMSAYQPQVMRASLTKWGQEIDRNLFTTTDADRTKFAKQGCDEHSLVGDALFVDPVHGDYRVQDGSPALKLGFINFPMDQFGVQKPALKKLARTPSFAAGTEKISKRDGKALAWLGGKIKNIVGLDEVSAAGLPGEIGVRIEQAPPNTALRDNDVILKCNGGHINTVADLLRMARGNLKLEVWRDQKSQVFEVEFR
ncbi:MAG: glycoside hydrolase N-terminal domain-containing protein [Verrucomicrobiota bacterium]